MKSAKSGRLVAGCLAGASLLLCAGCVQPRFNHVSVLSNQDVDLEKVDLSGLEGEVASGSTTGFSIFGIIPVTKARVSMALHQALLDRDADLLIDAVIGREKSWAILLGWETITVKGRAVKTIVDKDDHEGS